LAKKIAGNPGADLEPDRVVAVAKIGENVRIHRHTRWEVSGNGLIAAYIHTGAKVGVLVEVGATNEATVGSDGFKELVRDITLQIAAGNPTAVSRNEISTEILDKEDEIARNSDALKGKPAAAMVNILKGKREKYFQTVCLVEQGFVKKNGEITVKEHIATVGKALGDEVTVRRFLRYQIGAA
jgi:elongation factor Ts